jgi:hypothetical protein
MSPILLIVATLAEPQPSIDRGEVLIEALRFGMCRGMIAANLKTIELHSKMINGYPQYCQSAWEFRQTEVRDAWRHLDTALDKAEPLPVRMRAMDRLRRNIGDDAYHAGRLPCAIPAYGNWCPALVKE